MTVVERRVCSRKGKKINITLANKGLVPKKKTNRTKKTKCCRCPPAKKQKGGSHTNHKDNYISEISHNTWQEESHASKGIGSNAR